jgi:hypothetical protein
MRSITPILAVCALVGAACTGGDSPSATDDTSEVGGGGSGGRFVRALVPFDNCDTLLDHLKSSARDRVGAYGLNGEGPIWGGGIEFDEFATAEMSAESMDVPVELAEPAPEPAADGALGGNSDNGEFSTTNVQEVGVDEPDIVKTDGNRIVTISENTLTVVDVTGAGEVTGRLQLPEGWDHELFFAGDRAIVLTNGGNWGHPMPVDFIEGDDLDADADESDIAPEQNSQAALVFEIELTGAPSIVASMRIEGRYLSARAIGDTVRLAIASGPDQLPWLYPSGPASEERALDANRGVIDDSTLDDWLPSYELEADGVDQDGQLLACDRMHRPAEFAGFDVVSVVDVSLAEGLVGGFASRDSVGVLAGGDTIYSSTDRFYVATTTWADPELEGDADAIREWSEDFRTDLHAFSIAPGEPTRYVASGSVPGTLLNQFSIDEHDGFVRVLTTDGSPWDESNLSETQLTVLAEQSDQLIEVGQVAGLGRGEQLYSARLLDDVGFAVTFRQIDPFYVLDLSDPTDPTIAGELKIPGFSTYLHPVGDDRVLGLGQAATEDGSTTGLKLSLFDVSDPSNPRELSVWTVPNANSPAEYDHRSFQMWGSTAIVPVQSWSGTFNGAIVFEIGDSITEIGRITHADTTRSRSDCRPLAVDDVPAESEFFWILQDGYTQVQLCGQDDVGGLGGTYCDPIPFDELRYWFGDEAAGDAALARLGAVPGDRIEICHPETDWTQSIQRSVIIDGTLWTLTPQALQANDLETLAFVSQVELR